MTLGKQSYQTLKLRFNRLISCCVFAFALISTGCSSNSSLFGPVDVTDYQLSTAIVADSLLTHVTLSSGPETLYGVYARQVDTNRIAPHPVVVYHHGGQGNISDYWHRVELLFQAGFDVFVYDYRGFGRSTGTTNEASIRQDADVVMQYIKSLSIVDTNFIVHYGYDVGGYAALYSRSAMQPIKCVLLESTFARITDSDSKVVYDNMSLIQISNVPVMLLHGDADELYNYLDNAVPLYNAASNPKRLVPVPGASHNNVPTQMNVQYYMDVVTAFIRG